MNARAPNVIQLAVIDKASGILVGHLPNNAIDKIGGYSGIVKFVTEIVEIRAAFSIDGEEAVDHITDIMESRLSSGPVLSAIGGREGIHTHVRQVLSVYEAETVDRDSIIAIEKALTPILDFGAGIPEHVIDEDRAPVDQLTAGHFRELVRMWPKISAVLAKNH